MPAAREKDKSRRKVDEEEIGKYLNNVISGLVHKKQKIILIKFKNFANIIAMALLNQQCIDVTFERRNEINKTFKILLNCDQTKNTSVNLRPRFNFDTFPGKMQAVRNL